jgi:hypothetical protein
VSRIDINAINELREMSKKYQALNKRYEQQTNEIKNLEQ